MATIILSSLLLLLVIGAPIAFAIGLVGVVGAVLTNLPCTVIAQRLLVGLDSFSLIACPLFILSGELMDRAGLTKSLVDFSKTLVGHIRGSLAMICVISSMLFAGVSGSATADTAAVGSMLIPAMKKKGYDPDFAAVIQGAAGCIGPIIPPSVLMVVLGNMAGISVGKLFLGGVVPGILIGLVLLIVSYMQAIKGGNAYLGDERATFKEVVKAFIKAIPSLVMPVGVLVGIIFGVFTATEAAAAAAMYALILGMIVYKTIKFKDLREILLHSSIQSGVVMMIVGTAAVLGWVITNLEIPQSIAQYMTTLSSNKYVFFLIVNIFLLFVGMILEGIAALIILVPILLPITIVYGIDPIHFGVVMTVNLCIGMITPPVGVALFVSTSIAERKLSQTIKQLKPVLICMILVLLLITYIPQLITWLPNKLM